MDDMPENMGSVTGWLGRLREGDRGAADELCNRYFTQLTRLARARLGKTPRRVADEEDVASGVMYELVSGLLEDRFPDLNDRDDLWALLTVMTQRKAMHQVKAQFRKKRGGGAVVGESVFGQCGVGMERRGVNEAVGREPSPDFVVSMAENCERLFEILGDETLREVARMRMQGYEVKEIAERFGVAERSIGRKLALIRDVWEEEIDSDEDDAA